MCRSLARSAAAPLLVVVVVLAQLVVDVALARSALIYVLNRPAVAARNVCALPPGTRLAEVATAARAEGYRRRVGQREPGQRMFAREVRAHADRVEVKGALADLQNRGFTDNVTVERIYLPPLVVSAAPWSLKTG